MVLRWITPVFVLTAVVLLIFSNTSTDYVSQFTRLQKSLTHHLSQDSAGIIKFYNSDDDRSLLSALDYSPFYIEIYKNDSIIYWNDLTSMGETSKAEFSEVLIIEDGNFKSKISFNPDDLDKIYLRLKGDKTFHTCPFDISGQGYGDYTIKLNRQTFTLSAKDQDIHPKLKSIAWWLLFLSFMFISIIICLKIKAQLAAGQKIITSFFVLAATVLLFKSVHYLPAFNAIFGHFMLIKLLNDTSLPSPYISHFLINLFIFGIVIFLTGILLKHTTMLKSKTWALALLSGFYTFFIFGVSLYVISGFILSPDVNLEIEALMEFDLVSFVLIISFSLLLMLIFHSTHLLHAYISTSKTTGQNKFIWIASGWILALGLLSALNMVNVPVWILVLFISAYTLILDAYTENREHKITYLIWWLILFSGFLAVSLFYFGLLKDIKERTGFLQKYYVAEDPKILDHLSEIQDSLVSGDVFARIASLETSSKLDMDDMYQFMFKQKPGESADQALTIELFDKNSGHTMFNNHFADYYKLNQSYENARKVGKNIYHNPFEDIYYIRFEIDRSFPQNASWYLFVIQHPKNHQHKLFLAEQSHKYARAVFSRGKMIEKSDNGQASPDPALLSTISEDLISGGYSFVLSNPSDQYKIISWKKVSGLIKPISLFSFIFTLCGFILLLLTLINTKYDFLPENLSLKFGSRSSLKTKIQLAIILLILFTFLIIGAITSFYFKNLIEANQLARNKEETLSIVNNIRSDIQNMADEEYALTYLNSKLQDLSFVHNKELSIYDYTGKLAGSTAKGNMTFRIPFVQWNLEYNGRNGMKLNKNTTTEYVPLFLNENRPFAYIGIYHTAYNTSSGNILDFLSTILNAYIFLFLIAGAIAITIANSITQPLTILAEKLKKFKLGKTNELLEWKSNDEIGTLIHDYNNLTHELERSAGLLAKTERDMAWREMAKQVAHEIKNPLTPMKLSIQYLDRAAKDHPEKAQELIPRISSTLIEQIDNLSQIANEFSNFASMPQASNEKIILNEIVETIHDLFRKRDDMDINMIEPIDDLYVFADKNHLVRILNNLLKNAIQAIPENRRGKIEIELKRQDNDAIIRISDNGSGIPDHMKDKVFTPNFTTKSSGTGLGLAISANMIESFNGKIYFETKVGTGTDFFISIPLMRLDDYFGEENRVSLD